MRVHGPGCKRSPGGFSEADAARMHQLVSGGEVLRVGEEMDGWADACGCGWARRLKRDAACQRRVARWTEGCCKPAARAWGATALSRTGSGTGSGCESATDEELRQGESAMACFRPSLEQAVSNWTEWMATEVPGWHSGLAGRAPSHEDRRPQHEGGWRQAVSLSALTSPVIAKSDLCLPATSTIPALAALDRTPPRFISPVSTH